jgi:hypothetical protein
LNERTKLGFDPDTIVVLTDGEVNGFPYSSVKNVGKDAVKITVNLHSASTTPMSAADGWYTTAGFSSAMFKWIPSIREKASAVDQLSVPYLGAPQRTKVVESEVEPV